VAGEEKERRRRQTDRQTEERQVGVSIMGAYRFLKPAARLFTYVIVHVIAKRQKGY
jgi:hypothetical protein